MASDSGILCIDLLRRCAVAFSSCALQHWKLLTEHKPMGNWTITRDEYVVYFMQCARVLMPDEVVTEAEIAVRRTFEWSFCCSSL